MSFTTEASEAAKTAQAPPNLSHARTKSEPAVVSSLHAHARSAMPDAMQKILEMLLGMDERRKKLELS